MIIGKSVVLVASLVLGGATLACSSSDPTGSGGVGTLVFTTWGEEYIEDEIPADPEGGFVDGWSVSYDKFLVSFGNIVVADVRGEQAGGMATSRLFDNTLPGVKPIVVLEAVPAKAWDRISYEIAPVSEDTGLSEGVPESDKALMLEGGYSLYVSGVGTKGGLEKRFEWGFTIATRYEACQAEADGRSESGVVVTNNGQLTAELTTHGDHLFYDRLQSSPDASVQTSLRFEALAAADADADGTITLDELNATLLDVRTYDPSGLGASTLGAFVTTLARTVGHFRGEGECTVRAL